MLPSLPVQRTFLSAVPASDWKAALIVRAGFLPCERPTMCQYTGLRTNTPNARDEARQGYAESLARLEVPSLSPGFGMACGWLGPVAVHHLYSICTPYVHHAYTLRTPSAHHINRLASRCTPACLTLCPPCLMPIPANSRNSFNPINKRNLGGPSRSAMQNRLPHRSSLGPEAV